MTEPKVAAEKFVPNTVYVTYIASTPEKVWQALTDPEFTKGYFGGFEIRRFSCTWLVEGMPDFRELPECLVAYDIEQAGGAVKLTMTEAHSWDVPDEILAGGRTGWPAILSSLKSLLETGKPLDIKLEPPKQMMEAVKRAVAEQPWRRAAER
jgi:hypothetical protein